MVLKVLIVSDKECNFIWDFKDPLLKEIDLTISCGDLKSEYLRYIVTMTNKPLFYIHGNHDDHYLVDPPFGWPNCDSPVLNQGTNVIATQSGE